MTSIITKFEKLGDNEYILITEHGFKYHYTVFEPAESESERWRNMVNEAHQILIDWCENGGDPPAYIGWNCYGRAMLEIKLKNIYNEIPKYNNMGSEINPLEFKNTERWVVDKNCLFYDKRTLCTGTRVKIANDDTEWKIYTYSWNMNRNVIDYTLKKNDEYKHVKPEEIILD